MSQKKVGRPTVITSKVVSLLVAAFHSGMTVRETCWQSGISHEAYYDRLRNDQQFADTMTKAQHYVNMSAKRVIVSAIEKGDVSAAKWWLERKARDEFGKDAVPVEEQPQPVELDEAAMREILEDYKKIRAWEVRQEEYRAMKQPIIDGIRNS